MIAAGLGLALLLVGGAEAFAADTGMARDASCAVTSGGLAVCWGTSEFGQIAPPAGTYAQISVGWDTACALTRAGTVTCWSRAEIDPAAPGTPLGPAMMPGAPAAS